MRIGLDGWVMLSKFPDDELERLTELERAGNLTDVRCSNLPLRRRGLDNHDFAERVAANWLVSWMSV